MTPTEIREARQSLGLTQKQFGELLHATDRTVRMWESGDRNMTQTTAELLKIKIKEREMELNMYNVVPPEFYGEISSHFGVTDIKQFLIGVSAEHVEVRDIPREEELALYLRHINLCLSEQKKKISKTC